MHAIAHDGCPLLQPSLGEVFCLQVTRLHTTQMIDVETGENTQGPDLPDAKPQACVARDGDTLWFIELDNDDTEEEERGLWQLDCMAGVQGYRLAVACNLFAPIMCHVSRV